VLYSRGVFFQIVITSSVTFHKTLNLFKSKQYFLFNITAKYKLDDCSNNNDIRHYKRNAVLMKVSKTTSIFSGE
jgi:hypothetical protein